MTRQASSSTSRSHEETVLGVHTVGGRQVRTLAHESLGAGRHVREWDGRDAQGRAVAAGIYLIRLTAPENSLTQKLVLTK